VKMSWVRVARSLSRVIEMQSVTINALILAYTV
jgi:hypothetical protein